jgi:hypothetical protein
MGQMVEYDGKKYVFVVDSSFGYLFTMEEMRVAGRRYKKSVGKV